LAFKVQFRVVSLHGFGACAGAVSVLRYVFSARMQKLEFRISDGEFSV